MRKVVVLIAALSTGTAWGDSIRITAWNVGGFNGIDDDQLKRIVAGISILDADVYFLSEVNPLGRLEEIKEQLEARTNKCFVHRGFDHARSRLDTGFLVRCDAGVSDGGMVESSDLGDLGYRNASFVRVRIGEFDFVLVGLHLKSGRGQDDARQRSRQLQYVRAFIQGVLATGERDVLVVGDYNMIPGMRVDKDNFETLESVGNLRVVSSEEQTNGLRFTHIRRCGDRGNFLDGFAFTNVDAAEYVAESFKVVGLHQRLGVSLPTFGATYSDHLPLTAVFGTDRDHD